jgi:hypothetical protein
MFIAVEDVQAIKPIAKLNKSYYSVAWLALPQSISADNVDELFANKLIELIGHGKHGFKNIGGIGLHVARDKFGEKRVLITIQVKQGKKKEFTDKSVRDQLDEIGVSSVQLGELPTLQHYPPLRTLHGELYGKRQVASEYENDDTVAAAKSALLQADPQHIQRPKLLQRLQIVEQQLQEIRESEKIDDARSRREVYDELHNDDVVHLDYNSVQDLIRVRDFWETFEHITTRCSD